MALLDKLRELRDAPADADLLAFLGVEADRLRWDRDSLTVGDETVPMEDARAALFGEVRVDDPRRTVEVRDL